MATILIVDDRPTNRLFLLTLLGYGGHQLLEASNGVDALYLVRSARPDLVITDILMPTMDGYEFVRHLRADPDLPRIPVIFYTATYSEPRARELAASCGVDIVLPKPCDPERILAAVSTALGTAAHPAGAPVAAEKAAPRKAGPQLAQYVESLRSIGAELEEAVQRGVDPGAGGDSLRRASEHLSENVMKLQRMAARLSAFIEVGMEMTGERDPGRLVEIFFGAACDIIDSRYAAVGVLDEQERSLRYVFAKGLEERMFRGPRGGRAGLLKLLLDGRPALRARGAGSRSAAEGLPRGHPAVDSFLGVPVATAERVYGWLYFAERRGAGGFGEEDERLAAMMAAKLAVLYENALLYDAVQSHAVQLQVEIAERREAERAARESEVKFRELVEQASDGIFVTDDRGNFLLVNSRYCEMLGYSERELLALNAEHTYLPEERDDMPMRFARLREAGSRMFERLMLRKDGSTFPVEINVRALRNGTNQGIVRDITERRKAQQALAESEERFRQMAENIRDVFFLIDPDSSRVHYVSPAYEQVWGSSRDSLYAQPRSWTDSIHPEDREHAWATFTGGMAGGFDYEYRIVRPDASIRWIRVRGYPVLDESGRQYRTAGVASDVTERKQAQEKIRRLNRVHAVLSGINGTIVRVQGREDLFREACRIAVNAGRFSGAWVGVFDRAAMEVKPVAWYGATEGMFDAIESRLSLGDNPGRSSLLAHAVREKKATVSNDLVGDERIVFKDVHLVRGNRSLAMLPLLTADQVVAVLVLYADVPGFFDQDEMALLEELAGDISFALDHIEKGERLAYLAYYDALTGLANRRLFLERIEQVLRVAGPERNRVALVIFDVERFGTINDSLGRKAGDELLRQIARRMGERAGDAKHVARVGADQFGVVVAQVQSEDELVRLCESRLREVFAPPYRIDGAELRVSARLGIALFPEDGADSETLFRNAEAALGNAKTAGQRLLFYTQQMTERISKKLAMENKLKAALERKEFVLHYQPKVDLEGRICGLEALMRWEDPESGLTAPGAFIPVLEETGLILDVGAWALRQAIADREHWRGEGVPAPRIAVNVSPVQLRQRDFVAMVREAIGAGPSAVPIEMEITESLIMEDIEDNIGKLTALRRLGISFAIDDFGTGYSSLGYLAKLPVQALKIDKSFVNRMLDDPDTMTLVSTIISMAHSLRLSVIAEGVETERQAKTLRELRCDELQGFLFGRPVPRDVTTELLRSGAPAFPP